MPSGVSSPHRPIAQPVHEILAGGEGHGIGHAQPSLHRAGEDGAALAPRTRPGRKTIRQQRRRQAVYQQHPGQRGGIVAGMVTP